MTGQDASACERPFPSRQSDEDVPVGRHLELVGEGSLTLDDTVERWLPGVVPNGENITIRQLLNMKAGLYDYPNDPRFEADLVKGNWAHKWQPTELAEIGASHKPLFAPGKGWSYCNTCYVLAGLIIEKATGNPVGAELKQRIFTPLRLRGTTFDSERRIAGRHVHGYFRNGKQLIDTSLLTPSWAWAAGAIVSTADDIATFYRALLQGQVIKPELLAEMQATVAAYSPTQRYGLGLAQLPSLAGSSGVTAATSSATTAPPTPARTASASSSCSSTSTKCRSRRRSRSSEPGFRRRLLRLALSLGSDTVSSASATRARVPTHRSPDRLHHHEPAYGVGIRVSRARACAREKVVDVLACNSASTRWRRIRPCTTQ